MQNESARLFRALLQKQLREQRAFLRRSARTGKQRSMVGKILFGGLYAVVVLTLMGSFGAMAWPLGELLLPRGLDAVYFLPMELLALLVGVLAGALSSYSSLFQAKDNDLLLAMPIPPWMIFVVRLLGLYSTALFYTMIAWVPTEIVYGLYAQKPAAGLWSAMPMALLIAGAAAVLSALIGWGVALAAAKTGRKTLVTVLVSVSGMLLCSIGYQKAEQALGVLLQTALRAENLSASVRFWLAFGRAASGNGWMLLVVSSAFLLLAALFVKALSRPYLTLMTTRNGTETKKKSFRTSKKVSLRRTLLRRELLHLGNSAAYLLNCSMGTVGLLVLGGAALWKAEPLRALAARLPSPEYGPMFAAFFIALAAGTNFLTAPSVSLEGESLWLLQSLPVTGWQVLRAKLELHLLLTLPPALFCEICVLAVLEAGPLGALLSVLLVVLYVFDSASVGLILGVLHPSFHWTSETVVIKQSPFCFLALFGSWAGASLLCVVVMLLSLKLPVAGAMALVVGVLALLDAAALRWLKTAGAQKFSEL